MLTRPFTRLVVAFGVRKITQRRLVEELVTGILILIPFGFIVGLMTSRLCTKIHFERIRSDIWTTIVVFLVGDILMEWLLPSLSCLPMAGQGEFDIREDEYHYTLTWLLQSYGLYCPPNFASSDSLLSPDATAILFSLRLVFLCMGVHIGESLCFVALTGGIATGKSTVGRILVDYNNFRTTDVPTQNANSSTNHSGKRKLKKTIGNSGSNTSSNSGADSGDSIGGDGTGNNGKVVTVSDDGYKEGTVNLICADSIAHDILLPPEVLAGNIDSDDDGEDDVRPDDGDDTNGTSEFIVQPKDSVYEQIVAAFDGKDILTAKGRIDRLKLGAIIFNSRDERRKLNQITHPKILMILIRKLLASVFFGNCDITVADLPLLFESGKLSWLFGVTICVTVSDHSTQFHRLQNRNPELSKEECQARIDSQMPLTKKVKLADIVIDNSGDLHELSEQVEEARRDIMGRLYGIGMSLLQMLLLIGGSTSIAVSSKFYTHWQQ
jgi:dephospho-CoA kinase